MCRDRLASAGTVPPTLASPERPFYFGSMLTSFWMDYLCHFGPRAESMVDLSTSSVINVETATVALAEATAGGGPLWLPPLGLKEAPFFHLSVHHPLYHVLYPIGARF